MLARGGARQVGRNCIDDRHRDWRRHYEWRTRNSRRPRTLRLCRVAHCLTRRRLEFDSNWRAGIFGGRAGHRKCCAEALAGREKQQPPQYDASKLTAHEVAAAAQEGDQLALDVFHYAGRLLGFGIANMVSLFDPEIVIIGGGMAGAADLYLDSLSAAMLERAQPLAAKKVKLVVSKLGDRANLFGCARLAWQSLETRKPGKERR